MSEPLDEASIRQDVEALTDILITAKTMASSGVGIDLSSMDGRIDRLCRQARLLPSAQAKGLLPGLDGLVNALDTLRDALAQQKKTLASAVEGKDDLHTARQRASAAYGRIAPQGPIEVPLDPSASHDPKDQT